jgi:NMT1/THI5 like
MSIRLFNATAGLLVLFACTVSAPAAFAQQKLSVGIASTVSDTAGLLDLKDAFAPITDAIAKATKTAGNDINAVPPTLLKGTLQSQRSDVMIVLASDAWRAQNEFGWKLAGVSDDSRGNVVHLIARKGSDIKSMADLKGKRIAASGSFSRDVLGAVLKQHGISNQVGEIREARDAGALAYFLTNSFSDVVVSRDAVQIKQLTDAGHTVMFKTEAVPVYAVIVNPKTSLERTEVIRNAVVAAALSGEFVRATGIKSFKPLSADHSVALSLFD